MPNQYNVGILLFDHVDALDFAGPYEVFNMTTYEREDVNHLLKGDLPREKKPFLVHTVSENGQDVHVNHGLIVSPDYSLANCPSFDVIIVPGGPLKAITAVSQNKAIIDWIASYHDKLIASVCTGALFVAQSGALAGKRATTHHSALRLLETRHPDIDVVREGKFVDEGTVVTSAGVSAGINMALHVVKKLLGEETAHRTASTINFTAS
ncbi:DJ-1/PfpI family protein [Alkalihalobacillus oceani]|uniref:DJ-1/PfpI family protein n=1 Tax=Halalkalibacter oceani TaxID=1653776 RepID=UPI00204229DE|nr:DJ-1/PfpI family protein [Halalkalibacter oceani]MCM3761951.1 DJ-1/PfpI family protein [Halalkalibacter oceani]